MERLTERYFRLGFDDSNKLPSYEAIYERLRRYENLEEQNRLLELPYAVGDTVYTNVSMQGWYFRKDNRPYKASVVFIGINGVDNFMNVDFGNGRMLEFKLSDIGKTVFFAQEQAEAALQKMNHDGSSCIDATKE